MKLSRIYSNLGIQQIITLIDTDMPPTSTVRQSSPRTRLSSGFMTKDLKVGSSDCGRGSSKFR